MIITKSISEVILSLTKLKYIPSFIIYFTKTSGDLIDTSHNRLETSIILFKFTINRNFLSFCSSSKISKSFFENNSDLALSNLLITG